MNITLIPPSVEYCDLLMKWRDQADSVRFNPLQDVSLEEIKKITAELDIDLSSYNDNSKFRYFIQYENGPVGSVSLKSINSMMKTAEIGYGIDEELFGRGIATFAIKMWIEKIFKETDLRKISAYVHEENIGSQRVLEKNGFTLEGTMREQYLIDGKPVNEKFYGILRSEI